MNWKAISIFLLILLLAFFLRVYHLGSVPPSLDWDEVAIGWNAYGIWDVRLDEYGTRLPLSFKSFGDYKAPLLIYLTAPFVGILGLEPWVVRLPSALTGTMTVLVLYFLVLEICRYLSLEDGQKKLLAYLSMFLLAVSPWHLLFSRPSFEPNIALFWIVLGTWFFLLGLRKNYFWPLSGVSFVLALYTYHSPKLFLPVFLPALLVIFRKELIKRSWLWLASVVITLSVSTYLVYPLLMENLHGKAASRIATSIFYTDQGKPKPFSLSLVSDLGKNYAAHLQPSFYLSGQEENFRLSLKNYGLMPVIQWLFMIAGLILLLIRYRQPGVQLLLVWFVCGFMPAAIGKEVPHSLRSLNVLPALIVASAYGILWFYIQLTSGAFKRFVPGSLPIPSKTLRLVFLGSLIVLFVIDIGKYFYEYYVTYPVYAAPDWQYGYKEAVRKVRSYENSADKIVITSAYGQPYIFTYFFQKRQPMEVLWGGMIKYMFRDINWDSDKYQSNYILVGTGKEIPSGIPENEGKVLDDITFPDGTVAFRIVQTVKRE